MLTNYEKYFFQMGKAPLCEN